MSMPALGRYRPPTRHYRSDRTASSGSRPARWSLEETGTQTSSRRRDYGRYPHNEVFGQYCTVKERGLPA